MKLPSGEAAKAATAEEEEREEDEDAEDAELLVEPNPRRVPFPASGRLWTQSEWNALCLSLPCMQLSNQEYELARELF